MKKLGITWPSVERARHHAAQQAWQRSTLQVGSPAPQGATTDRANVLPMWRPQPNRADMRRHGFRNAYSGKPWPNTRHRTGQASLNTHVIKLPYVGAPARHGRRMRRQP